MAHSYRSSLRSETSRSDIRRWPYVRSDTRSLGKVQNSRRRELFDGNADVSLPSRSRSWPTHHDFGQSSRLDDGHLQYQQPIESLTSDWSGKAEDRGRGGDKSTQLDDKHLSELDDPWSDRVWTSHNYSYPASYPRSWYGHSSPNTLQPLCDDRFRPRGSLTPTDYRREGSEWIGGEHRTFDPMRPYPPSPPLGQGAFETQSRGPPTIRKYFEPAPITVIHDGDDWEKPNPAYQGYERSHPGTDTDQGLARYHVQFGTGSERSSTRRGRKQYQMTSSPSGGQSDDRRVPF